MVRLALLSLVYSLLLTSIPSCGSLTKEKPETVEEISQDGTAIIEIVEDFVDLGTIAHGEVVSYTFSFSNKGDGVLLVKDLIPECGCTLVKVSEKVVKPEEKASIEVVFNSRGWHGSQYKSVNIISNATTPSRSVTIKVNVV